MKRFVRVLRSTALIAVAALAVGSCDRGAQDPTGPATPDQSLLWWGHHDDDQDWELIRERTSLTDVLKVTQVIGVDGGEIVLLGRKLTVPAGAVDQPTLFTVAVLPNGYLSVDMLALRLTWLGRLLNIGAQGFDQPLTLEISYANATNVRDPHELKVLQYEGLLGILGEKTLVPSEVDTERQVIIAHLEHFTGYCVAQ